MAARRKKLTKAKAKELLKNPPGGRALSEAQEGFFGAVAGGATIRTPSLRASVNRRDSMPRGRSLKQILGNR